MAILTDEARPVITGRMLVPAIGVVLLTLTVAAARPQPTLLIPVTPRVESHQSVATPHAPIGALTTIPAAATQADPGRDSACWWNVLDGRSFSGNISTNNTGGRMVINDQVGTRGADRVIQKRFGDLQLCMLAEDAGDRRDAERPSQWLGRARRVVMETRRGSAVQTLEIVPQGGGTRTTWRVGGTERPFDAEAQRWRDRMLAALDTMWELAVLRGEASSLRGQISSIRGQQSSIRGEISSFRGEVSSMRGRISSLYGEVSSLRGQISSIQGHVSSLRGAISSEQGAMSSLNGSRYRATDAELRQIGTIIARHQDAIARIEQEIRDYNAAARVAAVERDIQALDAGGKVAAIEAEIRAFDLDGKVAAAERRIAELDVDGKVAAIERQIQALDVDRRSRQLEERRDSELKQLEAAIAAIR